MVAYHVHPFLKWYSPMAVAPFKLFEHNDFEILMLPTNSADFKSNWISVRSTDKTVEVSTLQIVERQNAAANFVIPYNMTHHLGFNWVPPLLGHGRFGNSWGTSRLLGKFIMLCLSSLYFQILGHLSCRTITVAFLLRWFYNICLPSATLYLHPATHTSNGSVFQCSLIKMQGQASSQCPWGVSHLPLWIAWTLWFLLKVTIWCLLPSLWISASSKSTKLMLLYSADKSSNRALKNWCLSLKMIYQLKYSASSHFLRTCSSSVDTG